MTLRKEVQATGNRFGAHLWPRLESKYKPVLCPGQLRGGRLAQSFFSLRVEGENTAASPSPHLLHSPDVQISWRWQISWRSSQASQLGHFLGQGAGHPPSGSEKPTHSCLRPRLSTPLSISSCPTFWGPLEAKRAGNGRKWLSKFEARVQCFSVQCSTGILIETIYHGTVRAFQMFAIPSPAHCIRGVFPSHCDTQTIPCSVLGVRRRETLLLLWGRNFCD